MIVADCNLIVGLVIARHNHPLIASLRMRDADWHAPVLWEVEMANALRKYERAGRLLASDCDAYAIRALELFERSTHQVSLFRALAVSRQTGCSVYDSHYIALAEDLGVPLYTYDEEILRNCPGLARKP